ncbi:ABC transporter ATP-binding protein [Hydrogenophaga sp.]|uniref:ABC transporter ATP-binding protein n=1 Tax=Hydrogenophaga sp. TaxID=1904254 RepID=UPI003561A422
MSLTDALLSAQGLRKHYGALVVLDGVDFEVRRGDAIGIVGPNGAGKTTLLSLLSGSQAATAGTIGFKGSDVSSLDAATRCKMGIVRTHQVPQPFGGMTVFENVFTAATHGGGFRRNEAYERSIDAIELCGMHKVANRRAATLGLLDRKRLELTRALATNPQVLLLDEIGGGLTDGEAAELVQTIKVLHARDIAIVWIEHIVHVLLQVAQRLVCMDAGRVIAQGDPQEVLANATVVDAYLGGGR